MHDEQALIRRSTELGHYLLEAGRVLLRQNPAPAGGLPR